MMTMLRVALLPVLGHLSTQTTAAPPPPPPTHTHTSEILYGSAPGF